MDGSIDQDAYVDCLAKNLVPYLAETESKTQRKFIFQEDGASCHTGSYATWFKRQCQVKGFPFWPAQSPDLNPIEHVWHALDKRVKNRIGSIKNVEQLKACLQEEWRELEVDFARKLVASMPNLIAAKP